MQSVLRTILVVAAVTGVVAGAALTSKAQAEPNPKAHAASCNYYRHWVSGHTQTVKLFNSCGYRVTARVRKFGRDTACVILEPGHTFTATWVRFVKFYGVQWGCIAVGIPMR
jgi:hypothetical protein